MHTRAITTLLVLLALAAACSLAPRAVAQQNQASVRLEAPQRMYVGDTSDLQIVVTGSRNVEAPDLSTLRDFDVVYRAPQDFSSQSMIIMNGRMQTKVSVTYAHLYSITPRHAGQLEIPAIPVVIDGKIQLTRPTTIEVTEPKQAEGFKLELASDHASAFVGEPITVRMVWTLPGGSNVRNVLFALPIEGAPHELLPGPLTRGLNQNDSRSVVLPFNGVQVLALHESQTVTVDRTIIPSEPGDIIVGLARVDFQNVTGQRAATTNDFFFGTQFITERQFSSAASLTVHVQSLPTAGRPANFSGLVGAYGISATADANSVSVGDPINLTVAVSGPYPLSSVPAMDLTKQSALKAHFRVPRDPILSQTNSGAAIFQAMIRARGADVTQIDPISLNYFDTQSRQYRTVQTGAIPLMVKASNTVSLPDDPDADKAPPPPPEHRPGGLADLDRTPTAPGTAVFNLHDELRRTSTIAIVAGPPAFCALAYAAFGFRRWQRRDPASQRRRAALGHLRRTIRRGKRSPIESAAAGLCNFAADWFDEPRDTLTAPRAGELFATSGTLAGTQMQSLLLQCDTERFGGPMAAATNPAAADLPAQAVSLAREFIGQTQTQPRETAA